MLINCSHKVWTSRKWATCAIGAIDYRAVIATAAIEVMVELP
jgi:hypothetical protein